jgi:hypothetical protein
MYENLTKCIDKYIYIYILFIYVYIYVHIYIYILFCNYKGKKGRGSIMYDPTLTHLNGGDEWNNSDTARSGIYMYIYMYLYLCIYIYMYVFISMYIYTYIYI